MGNPDDENDRPDKTPQEEKPSDVATPDKRDELSGVLSRTASQKVSADSGSITIGENLTRHNTINRLSASLRTLEKTDSIEDIDISILGYLLGLKDEIENIRHSNAETIIEVYALLQKIHALLEEKGGQFYEQILKAPFERFMDSVEKLLEERQSGEGDPIE